MNKCTLTRTSDFDYELPEELIAQFPPEKRGASRMLVLDPASGAMKIVDFTDIAQYLAPGDMVVVNNTKVIRARLFALKKTGAKIEILLLAPLPRPFAWQCLVKPAKRISPGDELELLTAGNEASGRFVTLEEKGIDGVCSVTFREHDIEHTLSVCGHMPLPPYIKRKEDYKPDSERYQTVYASNPGAVAAPTAGLHFTEEVFSKLSKNGVRRAELTLHVGQGTFKPVTAEKIADHNMHSEFFILDKAVADSLNSVRANGKRILAVGTTSLRALESSVGADGSFTPKRGGTSIFIYPPYKIRSCDMMLTNFHLPKSTLLMLVSAFAGFDLVMEAYKYAISKKMRFFSYGDCMLILNKI